MYNEQKCDAIVLKTADYKDYDKVLTIFSADFGKQKVLLKGCKREKAKQRYAGQPFFFGEFLIAKGKGYDIVTTVAPKKTFIDLTKDYDAYLNASLVLKTIDMSCLSQTSERQFLLLLTYLTVLEKYLNHSELFTCKFFVEHLKMQGLSLNINECSNCGNLLKEAYFDTIQNSFVCENCRTYQSLPIKNSQFFVLKQFDEKKFMSLVDLDYNESEIKALKTIIFDAIQRIFQ